MFPYIVRTKTYSVCSVRVCVRVNHFFFVHLIGLLLLLQWHLAFPNILCDIQYSSDAVYESGSCFTNRPMVNKEQCKL